LVKPNQDPYRVYANEHWRKIFNFVNTFLLEFYGNDENLQNDTELRNFFTELFKPDGGNFKPTTEYDNLTLEKVVHFVSSVIFNSSVVHSAVNFTQARYFGYTPAHPAILREDPPTDRNRPPTGDDNWGKPLFNPFTPTQDAYLKKVLPLKEEARAVYKIVDVLSTATDVAFGDYYEHHHTQLTAHQQTIVSKFLDDYQACPWRFQALRMKYTYLLPSRIAMSISI